MRRLTTGRAFLKTDIEDPTRRVGSRFGPIRFLSWDLARPSRRLGDPDCFGGRDGGAGSGGTRCFRRALTLFPPTSRGAPGAVPAQTEPATDSNIELILV